MSQHMELRTIFADSTWANQNDDGSFSINLSEQLEIAPEHVLLLVISQFAEISHRLRSTTGSYMFGSELPKISNTKISWSLWAVRTSPALLKRLRSTTRPNLRPIFFTLICHLRVICFCLIQMIRNAPLWEGFMLGRPQQLFHPMIPLLRSLGDTIIPLALCIGRRAFLLNIRLGCFRNSQQQKPRTPSE